ncbi:UDP-N-acetylmuramate dehydrogenase [Nonomuraea sp. NPDC050227]|uniref:UDP-N-acetylmuramate dehydrogenase n=1 Tax=Nonomuraea sp. NPDC050227 TaxID=3364360 RepID=UPI003790459B
MSGPSTTAGVPLGPLTTFGVGGPCDRLSEIRTPDDLIDHAMTSSGPPPLILGEGSNVVVADQGYPHAVLLMRTRGLVASVIDDSAVDVTVAAGEPFSHLIDFVVSEGFSGLECLAGIPGTVGALPIQNVGAYGQEVAQTITRVEVWDWARRGRRQLTPAECLFGYRSSLFKENPDRHTVMSVSFRLSRGCLSAPITYDQVAVQLGTGLGARVPISELVPAILAIRRRKGMVVDPADPESRSAGSFFLNPLLAAATWAEVKRRVAALTGHEPPVLSGSDGLVRTSAGWLMEKAGFQRGQRFRSARISRKHTLALVADDGTTAADIAFAARTIVQRVHELFGVTLTPEPRFIGVIDT